MKKFALLVLTVLLFMLVNSYQVFAYTELREEIFDMRTENRKVYSLGNDTFRFEYYTNPIHYFDYLKNQYVEFEQELTYDLETTRYVSRSSNYQVSMPTKNSANKTTTLDFNNLYILDIDFFGEALIQESYISTVSDVYSTYTSNQNDGLSIVRQNTKLKSIYLIESPKSSRQIDFSIYTDNLVLKQKEDAYFFVDDANVAIFQVSNYYLLDSVGNMTFKIKVDVKESEKGKYDFSITLDDEFLDYENIVYPVNLVGGITYSLTTQSDLIRDKTIVKDTYEGYDTDILTIAKQKYYFFQNTPVYLSEYHSYSILELNFDELTGSNITVLDAKLYLNRYQSNVNAKLPLSEITTSEFDSIDGFTSYSKTLISQPTVNSENVVYDITDEIEEHVYNEDTTLLLELSPQFIFLGTSNLKYMNFISENADEYNSPYFTIDVYGTITTSSYGSAPSYTANSSTNLNCFNYALRRSDGFLNISSPSGTIEFNEIQVTELYFYRVVVPSVLYTILQQSFYNARILTSGYAEIQSFEYRIALRVGNIVNWTGNGFYTEPDNDGPYDGLSDDFHFLIQLSDGSWGGKQGNLPSLHFPYGDFPTTMNWDLYKDASFYEYIDNFYDSSTIYFAVYNSKTYSW